MISPMNPYQLSFNIWNKMDKEWFTKYLGDMAKEQSARDFRTLALDFGRRTGKTEFALDLLHRNPNNCIVVTPTLLLRDYNFKAYLDKYKPRRLSRDFRGIITASRLAGSNWMEGWENEFLPEYDPRKVDYIIFDEIYRVKPSDLLIIWKLAKEDAKFIMLGNPRI